MNIELRIEYLRILKEVVTDMGDSTALLYSYYYEAVVMDGLVLPTYHDVEVRFGWSLRKINDHHKRLTAGNVSYVDNMLINTGEG